MVLPSLAGLVAFSCVRPSAEALGYSQRNTGGASLRAGGGSDEVPRMNRPPRWKLFLCWFMFLFWLLVLVGDVVMGFLNGWGLFESFGAVMSLTAVGITFAVLQGHTRQT